MTPAYRDDTVWWNERGLKTNTLFSELQSNGTLQCHEEILDALTGLCRTFYDTKRPVESCEVGLYCLFRRSL